jgi:two-component system, response regulator RegA
MTTEAPKILIAEDNDPFRETLALEFEDRGYVVHQARDFDGVRRVTSQLAVGSLRFAVVDLRLGSDDGLLVVEYLATRFPSVRSVLLTGYGSLPTAVQAMKLGAVNYLGKPTSVERLERALWTDEADPQDVAAPDGRESLARHEREYVEYVLLQCDGNISKAARWLGIHRQSLQRKLRKFTP